MERDTVSGTLCCVEYTLPLNPSVICEVTIMTELAATAAALPFSVSDHRVSPEAEICGGPKDPVTPVGRPEKIWTLTSLGVAGPFAVPTGLAPI